MAFVLIYVFQLKTNQDISISNSSNSSSKSTSNKIHFKNRKIVNHYRSPSFLTAAAYWLFRLQHDFRVHRNRHFSSKSLNELIIFSYINWTLIFDVSICVRTNIYSLVYFSALLREKKTEKNEWQWKKLFAHFISPQSLSRFIHSIKFAFNRMKQESLDSTRSHHIYWCAIILNYKLLARTRKQWTRDTFLYSYI